MYAYEIKYKLKNDKEWQTYTTKFYDNSFEALKEAENFDARNNCEMISQLLLKK